MDACENLESLMKEQIIIIRRHLRNHQWYRQIENKEDAVADFVEKFGWVMREVYCDRCTLSEGCQAYQEYLRNNPEIDPEALKESKLKEFGYRT